MYKKNTDDLEKALESTHPADIEKFLEENADEMSGTDKPFARYMRQLLAEKGLQKQEVFANAGISLGYGYKLLNEEKVTRQRDVILRICYAAEFTVQETQRALELYHMPKLYVREKRDAMIISCFNERPGNVIDVNNLLLKKGFDLLRSSGVQD